MAAVTAGGDEAEDRGEDEAMKLVTANKEDSDSGDGSDSEERSG